MKSVIVRRGSITCWSNTEARLWAMLAQIERRERPVEGRASGQPLVPEPPHQATPPTGDARPGRRAHAGSCDPFFSGLRIGRGTFDDLCELTAGGLRYLWRSVGPTNGQRKRAIRHAA